MASGFFVPAGSRRFKLLCPQAPASGISFLTTNLDALQYRIARERVIIARKCLPD